MNRYILILVIIITIIIYTILQIYGNNIKIHTFDSGIPGINLFLIGGTHGNEPSGSVALTNFIEKINCGKIKLKRGKIVVIDKPNKLGILFNNRYLLHRIYNRDLNRNYPRNAKERPLDPISRTIVEQIHNSDWILDFHEGWGYINEQQGSMGSGIFPGKSKEARELGMVFQEVVNAEIDDKIKKFGLVNGIHPDIRSLKNFCDYIEKHYILIETSGQNDIQPLDIRVKQVDTIINLFLKSQDMI
jgi:hypothetical protein